MSTVKWLAVHAIHWAILYGAFVAKIDGALYVIKFFVWAMAILSPVLLTDQAVTDSAKKPPQPVRGWMIWLQASATLGLLVWFGHIASALAWCLVMVMTAVQSRIVRKVRASAATSAE